MGAQRSVPRERAGPAELAPRGRNKEGVDSVKLVEPDT